MSYLSASENWCIAGSKACNQNYKPSNPPSPILSQSIVIIFIPTNTIARLHIFLETSCLKEAIFILILVFSDTIHAPSSNF